MTELASGRLGVDAFDPAYGAGFEAGDAPERAQASELVEDGGVFRRHRPEAAAERPGRLAFVDGVMRTEARLTLTAADGEMNPGLAGSWAAGAALVDGDRPARIDRIAVGRVTVFAGGRPARLPEQPGGWRWEAFSVPGGEFPDTRDYLQRLMRDAEANVAEALCDDGWLTVLDGPLYGIRRHRQFPLLGYVKTHHRRTLAPEAWAQVPGLRVGERSGLFALGEVHACYLRVGDPGPWASGWSGIARIETPARIGLDEAIGIVDRAAGWLPRFASPFHRDPRAPVNLSPISGLERHLHHLQGDRRLALRAVREAAVRRNQEMSP